MTRPLGVLEAEGKRLCLLRQADVAALLAVAVRTVRDLPIRRVRIGRAVRYRLVDVERYVARLAGDRKGAA